MAELKTKVTNASVTDFINSVSDKTKREDSKALLALFKTVTKEKPKMWGELGGGAPSARAEADGPSRGRAKLQQQFVGGRAIVGFGMYHYKSERSSQEGDWMLTGFSPRKQDLTLYIMLGLDESADLLKKLGKHKRSVGCLYIKKLEDVDQSILKKIIQKSFVAMKKKYKN